MRVHFALSVAAGAGLLIPVAAAHADPLWWCPKKACYTPCCIGYTPGAWRPWPCDVPEVLPSPAAGPVLTPRPAPPAPAEERELLPPPRVTEP